MKGPENNSIQAIAAYIREYIDPQGNFTAEDDAAQAIEELDRIWAADGGTHLSVEQLQEYLDSLR
jgi:hypothetical protein